jgi:hypothetical protein
MLSNAYVDHDTPEGSAPGPQATRAYVSGMLIDYPDLRFTVDGLVTLDHHVAIRARWHGTHRETGAVVHQAGVFCYASTNQDNSPNAARPIQTSPSQPNRATSAASATAALAAVD